MKRQILSQILRRHLKLFYKDPDFHFEDGRKTPTLHLYPLCSGEKTFRTVKSRLSMVTESLL